MMLHDVRREQDTACNQSNCSQHDKNGQHSTRAGGKGFTGRPVRQGGKRSRRFLPRCIYTIYSEWCSRLVEVPCWLSRAFRLRQASRMLAFQQGCPAFITKDSRLNARLVAIQALMHTFNPCYGVWVFVQQARRQTCHHLSTIVLVGGITFHMP
jgi:hypothetical protein